jgi:hypothetical protein
MRLPPHAANLLASALDADARADAHAGARTHRPADETAAARSGRSAPVTWLRTLRFAVLNRIRRAVSGGSDIRTTVPRVSKRDARRV